ncbi:hypothetical protein J3A83DRAFT_4372178 [Scleroderma citrinum]
MTVARYAQPMALAFLPNPTIITIILCPPIAVAVQGYFVLRVYRLSEQPLLLVLGALLAISKFVLHLTFGIAAYIIKDVSRLVHEWGWTITSYLILSIACDTLIATSLSYHLNLRKTGFHRTSRIIDRMIIYALATGLITSATELAEAICFWTMPDNLIWMGLYVVESGLYTNSLLAALNSRSLFNQLRNSDVPYELGLGQRGSETAASTYRDQKTSQPIVISVTHETIQSEIDEAQVLLHDGMPNCIFIASPRDLEDETHE